MWNMNTSGTDVPRIIIAPDSFKGTASAHEAAGWLGEGVQQVLPDAEILIAPMADGGEGTSRAFAGTEIILPTTDAAGRLIEASYTWDQESATAYIDVAAASGLPAVADHPVPLTGDTYGTGVLIADAQTRGATTVALALGGSATIDGGSGILVALGAQPLNPRGYAVPHGGGYLGAVDRVDTAQLNVAAASMNWVLLTDVNSPATGEKGAAAVFGPQKGAEPEDVELLDAALARWCEILEVDPTTPGMGAAGGVGVGITWLSRLIHGTDDHVVIHPGAAVVAASLGLPELLDNASLIITGEGALDAQTATGKVVHTVTELAAQRGVRVGIAAGKIAEEARIPGALHVELQADTPVREQLIDAGKRLARAYLEN